MRRGRKSKLALNLETLRVLTRSQLAGLGGGALQSTNYNESVAEDGCNSKDTLKTAACTVSCPTVGCAAM